MSIETMKSKLIDLSQTIVIKIGSLLLRDVQTQALKTEWVEALATDIAALKDQGKNIILVSSGAIAMGRDALGIKLDQAPSSIPLNHKQAASAVGQFHVFSAYYNAFKARDITVAQALLTLSETENRRAHLNARETLSTLLAKGIIPIINENDTVSTEEIRFGDNDRLAVRVAQMVDADLVILLSTTDGLYTDNPHINPEAEHIPLVEAITDEHTAMAGEAVAGLSTGGMKSKLEAARYATQAGIPLIIASGVDNHALKVLQDGAQHTLFTAFKTSKSARKRWIEGHVQTKGRLIIDEGAQKALEGGKSLLPVGVIEVKGAFLRGDAVEIFSNNGKKIGIGLSAYDASEAQKLLGQPSSAIADLLGYTGRDEIIHRNDMVLQD